MIMSLGQLRRYQEGGDVTTEEAVTEDEVPFVSAIDRRDVSMDPIMGQLLFGQGGQGGFIPGAFRAAERTFFDDEGKPIVVPQEIADFSPDQLAAFQAARANVGVQQPFLKAAQSAYAGGIGDLDYGLDQQMLQGRRGLSQIKEGAGFETAQRMLGLQDALGGIRGAEGLYGDAFQDLGQRLGGIDAQSRGDVSRFGGDVDLATSGLSGAGQQFGQRLGESEGLVRGTTGDFDQDLTQEFFDPYEDAVVQQTIKDAMKGASQADIRATASDLGAGGESAFGSRGRLRAGERAEAIGRGLGKEIGALRGAGFQRSQDRAMSEFERRNQAKRGAAGALSGFAGQRYGSDQALTGQRMGAASGVLGAGQNLTGQLTGTAGQRYGAGTGFADKTLGLGQAGMAARTGAGQGAMGTAGALAGGYGQLGSLYGAGGQQRLGAQQGYGGFLTGLGSQMQGANQADINMMQGIGGLQQQHRQQILDAQRGQLEQARMAPLNQYQSLMPFVSMAGQQTGPSAIGTTFTPPPSAFQAGVGTGLSTLGGLGSWMNPRYSGYNQNTTGGTGTGSSP